MWEIRVLTRKHLGKSVRWKAYSCTMRHAKHGWWSWVFLSWKDLYECYFYDLLCAKTMYKLLWNSKNVKNMTNALNLRENIKWKTHLDLTEKFFAVGKMMLHSICAGWLNPKIWYTEIIKKTFFEFSWNAQLCLIFMNMSKWLKSFLAQPVPPW